MKMGDKIKMDIKHTDSIILNLFHNASTKPKFMCVDCFHGLNSTDLKKNAVFRFSDEEAKEEILIFSGPKVHSGILNQMLRYAYL
jgi:hypothetical protein